MARKKVVRLTAKKVSNLGVFETYSHVNAALTAIVFYGLYHQLREA